MFQEFLETGANLYVDMGTMFTILDYFSYSNAAEMKSLFGVQSNSIHFVSNPVNSLFGMSGSPMEDIHFYQSNQPHSWYIDDLEVSGDAVATFTEGGYGIVSVMNDGASTFGHKAFYLGYALAELVDVDPVSSRDNVLLKVLDFFEILPEDYLLAGFLADKHDGPSPMEVQFTDLSLSDPDHPIQSWEWDFNNDGEIDSNDPNPDWTFNDSGEYDITLIISNDMTSDTLTKHAFITVNHGFLVYEGIPDGEGYSGTFIKNYMEENAFSGVTYRNEFPDDLEGYNAVFLSFGNWTSGKTLLKTYMANIIIDYIEGGGFVYLEGEEALGFDQSANNELLGLFGLQSASDGTTNPINNLEGQADALTVDLVFTSSSQQEFTYVDIYVPDENALSAFIESDYGTVAVQNTGEYDQRTFCFSYTLADLNDGQFPNTRAELLNRICYFFDIDTTSTAVYSPVEVKLEIKAYPNPVKDVLSFSTDAITSIEIYDMMGALIIKGKSNKVDISKITAGIYFVIGFDKNNSALHQGKIIKK